MWAYARGGSSPPFGTTNINKHLSPQKRGLFCEQNLSLFEKCATSVPKILESGGKEWQKLCGDLKDCVFGYCCITGLSSLFVATRDIRSFSYGRVSGRLFCPVFPVGEAELHLRPLVKGPPTVSVFDLKD